MDIFKVSGTLIFQKIAKNHQEICFQSADLAYLNWNDKTKTAEYNLVIISIKLGYTCFIFFSFSLILEQIDISKLSSLCSPLSSC